MTREATPLDVIEGRARWVVVCGERDEVLASLGDAAVDVTITDPPYNERTHGGARTESRGVVFAPGINFAPVSSFDFVGEMLRASSRWVLAFCAFEHFAAYEHAAGAAWVRAGAWHKPSSLPQQTGDRPGTCLEGIAIMHRAGRKRWNGGGYPAMWSHVPHIKERTHPTQKPLSLMRELVRLFSDPGEVILDPHAGSGTTGVAALLEGRSVILVERNPTHAATCIARMEATEPGEGSRKAKQMKLSL